MKQQTWYIYNKIPNGPWTHIASLLVIVALVTPNLLSRHVFNFRQCYFLFLKVCLLVNACSLFFVNGSALQAISVASLQLDETSIFLVVYATFI